MYENKLKSKGGQSANSIKGNSTQISGENPTINNYSMHRIWTSSLNQITLKLLI